MTSEREFKWTDIHDWRDPAATWVTFVDDLRLRADLKLNKASKRRLLREAKAFCLFHGTSVFVPDSHLTDNPLFQQLYLDQDTGIASAFGNGMLVLAIRDRAPNLTEVNKQQGTKRSVPKMLEQAKPFVEKFDSEQYLDSQCARWSLSTLSGGFEGAVNKFIEQGDRILATDQRELLNRAIEVAKESARRESPDAPEDYFRFGDIYQWLHESKGLKDWHPVVRAARTAYLLNPGLMLGVDSSPSTSDLPTHFVNFISYGTPTEVWPADTEDIVAELDIPDLKVITQDDLDKLSFDDIRLAQKYAKEIGYFQALKTVRAAARTGDGWLALKNYVTILQQYVEHMKCQWPSLNVAPLDLYFQRVSQRLQIAGLDSRATKWKLLAMAVPMVLFGGGIVFTINAMGFTEVAQLLDTAFGGVGGGTGIGVGVGALANIYISHRFAKKEKYLRKTLASTMRVGGEGSQEVEEEALTR